MHVIDTKPRFVYDESSTSSDSWWFFTNPSEKNCQIWSLLQGSGWKNTKSLKNNHLAVQWAAGRFWLKISRANLSKKHVYCWNSTLDSTQTLHRCNVWLSSSKWIFSISNFWRSCCFHEFLYIGYTWSFHWSSLYRSYHMGVAQKIASLLCTVPSQQDLLLKAASCPEGIWPMRSL